MSDSTQKEKSSSLREQWRERIAEQSRSGASIRQFCKDHGLNDHSFYAWRKRLRLSEPVRFALVDRNGAAPVPEWNLELLLASGDRLRIGAGVEAATLRTVLEALRA